MSNKIRVCTYLEMESVIGGGPAVAKCSQIKSLKNEDIEVIKNPYLLDYNILHINTIGPNSLFLAHVAKAAGKKVIMHAHTTSEDFVNSYCFSKHISPWLRRYLKHFYNCGNLILCPSEYTKSLLESYGIKREIRVISNGVKVSRFSNLYSIRENFRQQYNLHGITPFCVGHVFAKKGVETFISLARKYPELRFIWFGTIYKKLAQKNTVKMLKHLPTNCTFTGYIKNILGAYAAGDIFVFPSHDENQGIVILEAAAAKKPIIVRDIPAYQGWLTNGKNCLKAKSCEQFSEHLQYLTDNPTEGMRLANNAYKMVQDHDYSKVGHELAEIYRYLMGVR